jgi:hypothetical protein
MIELRTLDKLFVAQLNMAAHRRQRFRLRDGAPNWCFAGCVACVAYAADSVAI